MNKEIHYDENIFYVALIIQTIRKGCSSDIDSTFFLDKIVEDIIFTDKILKDLKEVLKDSKTLIANQTSLQNLYLVKRDLVLLLEDIHNNTISFADHLKQYSKRFMQIIQSHRTDMMDIDDILNFDENQNDKKDIISTEEYQILLNNEEE